MRASERCVGDYCRIMSSSRPLTGLLILQTMACSTAGFKPHKAANADCFGGDALLPVC